MKKRPLTDEEKAECSKLKAIYTSKRRELGLTQEALAQDLEMSQAGLSMYLNGVNALNMEFAIKSARALSVSISEFSPRIAQELNAPGGLTKLLGEIWDDSKQIPMDNFLAEVRGRYDTSPINVDGLPTALADKIRSYRPVVEVPRYDISASMGPGTEPPEMNMVVEHMRLDAGWVRQNLAYTSLENLKLICGRGDSMSPTIRNGDALLVDSGVTSVEADAIYFFMMRGQHHVKRIQRNLDGLTIISDNSQYREIDVPGNREADIQVLAQIIYWWNGRSF